MDGKIKGEIMLRTEVIRKISDSGAVAVIRLKDGSKFNKVTEAILKGGVNCIELTMTVPNSFEVLEDAVKEFGSSIVIGMGTVLSAGDALRAINTGAQYIVSPVFKESIVSTAHENDVAVMPGCFTPTEILNAFEAGADIVKVFPADILGMNFFRAIKAPMPELKLMPTGGVTPENAGDWLKAGACAVGIGSSLLDQKAIDKEEYDVLTAKAEILIRSIEAARNLSHA
jgi:2-dehydro-3-deoxyphosphogluconate aldolase / (4S)-4-hydroxy-2-oxoglutarate aldolase